jgi:hypothetical protein
MRRTILSIAAAGSIFALTAAGASGLSFASGGTNSHVIATSGNLTITAVTCDAIDTVGYGYNGSDQLTSVTLTTADAGCAGLGATATVGERTASTTFPASATEGTYIAVITFETPVTLTDGANTVGVVVDLAS